MIKIGKLMLEEFTCPVCKKNFVIMNKAAYVYQKKHKKFCSWSCMRKFEKSKEETCA
jgi:hypothetical protein